MKQKDLNILNKKFIDPLGIGFMCIGCTGHPPKGMEAHIYDLNNIIRLGNHERAAISAEVLLEQGRTPEETAEEQVFPVMRDLIEKYEVGEMNRIQLAQSALTAMKALNSIHREAKTQGSNVWKGSVVFCGKEEPFEKEEAVLAKAIYESCGFFIQEVPLQEGQGAEGYFEALKEAVLLCNNDEHNGLKQVLFHNNSFNSDEIYNFIEFMKRNYPSVKITVWDENINNSELQKIGADSCCHDPMFGVKII